MTTAQVVCFPARRHGSPRPRGRGQAVLDQLDTIDDFSQQDKLSVEDRVFILFLVVVLADEDGRLATMLQRLAAAHATDPQHWAYGKTIDALRNAVGKWLGRGAVRRPRWHRVVDVLRAQIPAEHLPRILAIAAGLYCRATGQPRPDGEYCRDIIVPAWGKDPQVSAATIRRSLATLAAPAPGPAPIPPSPRSPQPPAAPPAAAHHAASEQRIRQLTRERDRAEYLLDAMIRVYREQQAHINQLETDNARLRYQQDHVHQEFVEFHQLRRNHSELRSALGRLKNEHRKLLWTLHPRATRETVDGIIRDVLTPSGKASAQRTVEWLT